MHWQEIHVLIGEIVLYGITGPKLNWQYEVDQKLFIISYIHLYRLVINKLQYTWTSFPCKFQQFKANVWMLLAYYQTWHLKNDNLISKWEWYVTTRTFGRILRHNRWFHSYPNWSYFVVYYSPIRTLVIERSFSHFCLENYTHHQSKHWNQYLSYHLSHCFVFPLLPVNGSYLFIVKLSLCLIPNSKIILLF